MAVRKHKDPEDVLLRRIMRREGVGKGEAVRRAKGRGLVKQAGRHLEPTAKGRKSIMRHKRGR